MHKQFLRRVVAAVVVIVAAVLARYSRHRITSASNHGGDRSKERTNLTAPDHVKENPSKVMADGDTTVGSTFGTHTIVGGTSCSTSGTADEGNTTSMLVSQAKHQVKAENITLANLKLLLAGSAGYTTVFAVVEELLRLEQGGVMIVIYDSSFKSKDPEKVLPVMSIGGGHLKAVMGRYAKKLFPDAKDASVNPHFRAVLEGFSVDHEAGPSADKWTQPILERMANAFGETWESVDDSLRLLLDEPADGAMAILSLKGTVIGASCKIKVDLGLELLRPNGASTGMRHGAAINAVEWCRVQGLQGAAVVRSDSRKVTLLCIKEGQTTAFQVDAA